MKTQTLQPEVQLIQVYRVCLKAHGLLHSSRTHLGCHGFTRDQTWSLHVTFQAPDMAGHSVCGAQSIHTIPRIVHDETGLNGLPVEDTEPASATYSPLTNGEACQYHNAHVTGVLTGPTMTRDLRTHALLASTKTQHYTIRLNAVKCLVFS